MQILCHYALPQFFTTTNVISLVYIATQISSLSSDWLVLVLEVLQFLLGLIIMVMSFMRHKYQIRKYHLVGLAGSFCVVSIILAINQFDHYYLMLIIIQLMILCLLMSFLLLNKSKIGFGVICQIYLIGFFIDFLSFDIWIEQDQFSLSRAIAILGSGGVGLFTLILSLLCHLKPQGNLQKELHIIIGFYIFCELFICCNIITEIINNGSNIYLINLILLKISNVYLDVLIYPFTKFHEPMMQSSKCKISTEIIENCSNKQLECNGIPTKESDSELDSALKIRSDKHIVFNKKEQNTTQKWIQTLLEIY